MTLRLILLRGLVGVVLLAVLILSITTLMKVNKLNTLGDSLKTGDLTLVANAANRDPSQMRTVLSSPDGATRIDLVVNERREAVVVSGEVPGVANGALVQIWATVQDVPVSIGLLEVQEGKVRPGVVLLPVETSTLQATTVTHHPSVTPPSDLLATGVLVGKLVS